MPCQNTDAVNERPLPARQPCLLLPSLSLAPRPKTQNHPTGPTQDNRSASNDWERKPTHRVTPRRSQSLRASRPTPTPSPGHPHVAAEVPPPLAAAQSRDLASRTAHRCTALHATRTARPAPRRAHSPVPLGPTFPYSPELRTKRACCAGRELRSPGESAGAWRPQCAGKKGPGICGFSSGGQRQKAAIRIACGWPLGYARARGIAYDRPLLRFVWHAL